MTWGLVGAALTLALKVFGYATDEEGLREQQKRKALANKKEECRKALIDNRFDDLKRLTDELERIANAP